MKKLIVFSFLLAPLVLTGQNIQPVLSVTDCVLRNQTFTANGNSQVIDNRPNTVSGRQTGGCSSWTVAYTAPSTVSALSITLQGAPDNAGTPGAYTTLGTAVVGSNPSTTTAQASFQVINGFAAWVRVNLASYAGSGTIQVSVWGSLIFQSTAASSATVSLVSVASAQADASTNTPRVLADSLGNAMTNPAYNFVYNGATWDRQPGDTTGTFVTIAGGTVALSGQQAVTASAVALATNVAKQVCVKALASNLINVFVGPSGITTSTGYLLAPGEGICPSLSNTNLLYVIASTTGASVSWLATR